MRPQSGLSAQLDDPHRFREPAQGVESLRDVLAAGIIVIA
jgi:hypothetical protein